MKVTRWALAAVAWLCAGAFAGPPAVEFTVLHSFDGRDGRQPRAPLVKGADGWLYGTTSFGGLDSGGNAFRIDAAGVVEPVHAFTREEALKPKGMILAKDGNFYGLSSGDSFAQRAGTAFRMSPQGEVSLLHAFTGNGQGFGCVRPLGALVQATNGDFYGTTVWGGEFDSNSGCVFRMTAQGELTVLHSLVYGAEEDGWNPLHGLVQADDGKLYGTTWAGPPGANGRAGTIFRVGMEGGYELVHIFEGRTSFGQYPDSALIDGRDGWLYGVTQHGGNAWRGVVYRINTNGDFEVVHSFRRTEGNEPGGELLLARDGYFYGVTRRGGRHNGGTVYRLARDGEMQLIHEFERTAPSPYHPKTALVEGADGELFGVTMKGGAADLGTVYRIKVK